MHMHMHSHTHTVYIYIHIRSVTQWVGGAGGGKGLLIALEHTQAEGGCFKVPLSMLFYYNLSITLMHAHTHAHAHAADTQTHTPWSTSPISLHPVVWASTFLRQSQGEFLHGCCDFR